MESLNVYKKSYEYINMWNRNLQKGTKSLYINYLYIDANSGRKLRNLITKILNKRLSDYKRGIKEICKKDKEKIDLYEGYIERITKNIKYNLTNEITLRSSDFDKTTWSLLVHEMIEFFNVRKIELYKIISGAF